MNRYRTVYYSKSLGRLNDITGLKFFAIQDSWNNYETVLIYNQLEGYNDLNIEKLFNNTVEFDLFKLLKSDKSEESIVSILEGLINPQEISVNIYYNKNNGNLLFHFDLEDSSFNKYTIPLKLCEILDISQEWLERISDEYYLIKYDG